MLSFFDMSSVNISRYNSELFKHYSKPYIAYVDDPELCIEKEHPNEILICSGGWSIKKISHSLSSFGVSILIISGQRIADFRFVLAANSLGIPVVYKMHGLYASHIRRNFFFLFF